MAASKNPTPNEILLLEERLRQSRLANQPETSEDVFFLISSIDTVLRKRGLSNNQIENGIVEGADDGGIDAVYVFVDGTLLEDGVIPSGKSRPHVELEIIQAKAERGFKEIPLQVLCDHLPLLLQLDSSSRMYAAIEFNPRVHERFDEFRDTYIALGRRYPELTVRVWYVTKAVETPGPKVIQKTKRLESRIKDCFSHASASVELVGAAELNWLARQRQATELELRISEAPIAPDDGGYICLARVKDYHNFITDTDGRLREEIFEENVRSYEGATIINKGISATLQRGTEVGADFWWLNNGVTIIGKKMQAQGKRLVITDPQIVNGLQTSRSIYNHFSTAGPSEGDPHLAGDMQLLIRAIQTEDEVISSQIIKATNSQNKVSAASLRSTEPFQRDLEEFLLRRGYFYERKRNQYKNQGKPRGQIVEVLELAQAVGAILLHQPDTSRGRPSSLIRDGLYQKVFSRTIPFVAYVKCIEVMRKIDAYLNALDEFSTRQERSNVRFHLARAACAFALMSSKPRAAAVAELHAESFDEATLGPALEFVLEARISAAKSSETSDTSALAKGPEWAAEINRRLSRYTDKTRWPKKYVDCWSTSSSTS